jgi:hypothetical protein
MPILVRTDDVGFAHLLEDRYGAFITTDGHNPVMELEIRLMNQSPRDVSESSLVDDDDADSDLIVYRDHGRWLMQRGDFRAEWDPQTRKGWVRQTANPYAIDAVLRIIHSLALPRDGGFLVHAASGVRNGRAFVFAGASGTGKTTLARFAPPDVTLLTDEISYLRPRRQVATRESPSGVLDGGSSARSFEAFGTPFAGELARIGEKVCAPLATLFLLKQGPENRIETVSESQALCELMQHVLFFAHDEELVDIVFQTVCDFVHRVPVRRLVFAPDPRVWELIA